MKTPACSPKGDLLTFSITDSKLENFSKKTTGL